jgi:Domain of unknown function (DUF397)
MNDGTYTSWRKSSYSNASGNCVEVAFSDWHKSSYSDGTGNCVEVAFSDWRKSSHSNSSGNCVEVAGAGGTVGVRDSKQHGRGPVLEFSRAEWEAFVRSAKEGQFDL